MNHPQPPDAHWKQPAVLAHLKIAVHIKRSQNPSFQVKFCKCSNDGVMLSTPEARFFSTFQTKKNGALGSLTAVSLRWSFLLLPPVLAPLALMPAPEAHRCLMRNRKTWASNRIPVDDYNHPELISSWSYAISNELGRSPLPKLHLRLQLRVLLFLGSLTNKP